MIDSDRFPERQLNIQSNNLFFRETEQHFLPLPVIDNFNQQLEDEAQVRTNFTKNDLQQQSLQPPITPEGGKQNLTPLFTSKPKCQPIVQKNLSSGENDNDSMESQKKNKQKSSLNGESNFDGRSPFRSADPKLARRKTIRRMNSKIRARQSIVMPKALTLSYTTKINNIVESLPFSIKIALVTIYALFGDDIRILTVTKDNDDIFFGLTIVCIVFFSLEIVLTCICKRDYVCNFYFWLDAISTATMILDIGWITDEWFSGDVTNASSIKTISSASKVARKAARVIRVIRLVRLIKLYKHARQQIQKRQQKQMLRQLLRQAQKSQEEKQQLQKQREQQFQEQSEQQLKSQPQRQSSVFPQYVVNEGQDPQNKCQHKMQESGSIKSKQLNSSQVSGNSIPSNQQIQKSNQSQDDGSRIAQQQQSKSPSRSTPGKSGHQTTSQGDSSLFLNIDQKESNVGQLLSDLVMRRVITVILAVLISIPLISLDTYEEKINSYDSGIFRIAQFKDTQNIRDMLIQQYAQFHRGQIYPIQAVHILVNDTWIQYNYENYPEYFESTKIAQSQY